MATPIINANLGKVVTATGNIADDLSTLRPLLRNILFNAYATDKVENTPIATFPDGADGVPVKSATFAIVPQQDLHGYDSPWPAGGGKNKLPITATTQTINGVTFTVKDDGTIVINGTATADATLTIYGANASSTTDIPIDSESIISTGTTSITGVVWKSGGGITFNTGSYTIASGNVLYGVGIRVLNGATANNITVKPMLRLSTETDDFAPYSNECPISGFTGAEITDAGTNLLDQAVFADYGTLESDGSYYIASPVPLRDVAIWSNIKGITGSLYLVMKYRYDSSSSTGLRFKIRYTDGTESVFYPTATLTETTISTPTSSSKTVKDIVGDFGSSAVKTWVNLAIYTEAITTYEPFVGTTHDITWQDEAGTVYGGTLQYMGGDSWRLTKRMESVDLGTANWQYSTQGVTYPYFYTTAIKQYAKPPADNSIPANIMCERYKTTNANAPYLGQVTNCVAMPTIGDVFIYDTAYTDPAVFKTAMSGTRLVYELATPVVYDLTGEELATVLGDNNVFSNTGDVTELVYRADTALYIEKKLAE